MTKRCGLLVAVALLIVLLALLGCSQTAPSSPAPSATQAAPAAATQPTAPAAVPAPTTAAASVPAKSNIIIRLGDNVDRSGPMAAAIGIEAKGWEQYWKYVNGEKGGIKGHQVELTSWDSKYNMDQAMAGYERLKQAKVIGAFSSHSTFEEAVKDRLPEDKITLVVTGGAISEYMPPGNIFIGMTAGFDKWIRTVDWIKDTWKGSRPPKLAALVYDNAAGRHFEDPRLMAHAKNSGVEFVGAEFIPITPTDTTPQLMRLSEKGADFVYSAQMMATSFIPVVRDIMKLGLKDKMTFVAGDVMTSDLLSAVGKNADGIVGVENRYTFDMDLPIVKLAKTIQQKYGTPETSEYYFDGIVEGTVMEKAIELALEKVSADKLDGNILRTEGFERMTNFDNGGFGPISFTAKDHRGRIDLRMARIVDGKVTLLEAKRVTDVLGFGR